jgi:hypothetical protein
MNNTLDQLLTLCQQLGVPVPPAPPPKPEPVEQPVQTPELFQPTHDIACYCPCDFRHLPVDPGTVDAIITDIPYVREWLSNAAEFAEWCRHVLKPGGVMVTWYSQHHLDECMAILGRHLHYQWILASPTYGAGDMRWLDFNPRFQLALVYGRDEQVRLKRKTDDVTPGGIIDWFDAGPIDKSVHRHQKTVCQMQYLVEAFTHERDLVCDPCAGSFTTAVACWNTNRRFLGGDINPDCLDMAREKFAGLHTEQANYG